MTDNGARLPIVESLIFASPEPLSARKIADVVENMTPGEINETVDELNNKYMENDLSIRIRRIAGGYQIYIIEDYARYVEDLLTRRRSVRLTRAALETLSIIAYRQPVTKMDIELIRGVASDSVIHTLMERRLITLAGRAETIGRPLLYKTTDEFLKFFNLNSLEDLPRMEEIEDLLAATDPNPQQNLLLQAVRTEEKSENDDIDKSDKEEHQDNEQTEEINKSDTVESPDTGESPEISDRTEPTDDKVKSTDSNDNLHYVESVEEEHE